MLSIILIQNDKDALKSLLCLEQFLSSLNPHSLFCLWTWTFSNKEKRSTTEWLCQFIYVRIDIYFFLHFLYIREYIPDWSDNKICLSTYAFRTKIQSVNDRLPSTLNIPCAGFFLFQTSTRKSVVLFQTIGPLFRFSVGFIWRFVHIPIQTNTTWDLDYQEQ
jgi:hypothetical protein